MKCPLSFRTMYSTEPGVTIFGVDCLKEECAWWSEELKQCDPTGMMPHIIALVNTLEELVNKMPHEEQFRR